MTDYSKEPRIAKEVISDKPKDKSPKHKTRGTGAERRYNPRAPLNLNVQWEGFIGPQKGTLTDISMTGCFVLCSGEVLDGQRVLISIKLLDGKIVRLFGDVISHVEDVGFSMQFSVLGKRERDFLHKLIHRAFQEQVKAEFEVKDTDD